MYSCETVWVKDGCSQILQYKHYTIKNNQCVCVAGRGGGGGGGGGGGMEFSEMSVKGGGVVLKWGF